MKLCIRICSYRKNYGEIGYLKDIYNSSAMLKSFFNKCIEYNADYSIISRKYGIWIENKPNYDGYIDKEMLSDEDLLIKLKKQYKNSRNLELIYWNHRPTTHDKWIKLLKLAGFKVTEVKTLDELIIEYKKVIPIFCFQDPIYLQIAKESGLKTGIRQHHINKNNEKHCYFLDNDFKNPDFEDYENLLIRLKPKISVLPDLFTQKEVNFSLKMWNKYKTIDFIFVPKYDCVNKLSKNAILGYPMSKFGGNYPIKWFKNHKVHLLGGTPTKQMKMMTIFNVVSVDGNSITKLAMNNYKAFHKTTSHWINHKNKSIKEILQISFKNTIEYLNMYSANEIIIKTKMRNVRKL